MTNLVLFEHAGTEVAFDPNARMWNLNAMYEAAGTPKNKDPRFWMRGAQAREFVEALIERETVSIAHSFVERDDIVQTREGRNGGTWAHWQIAAAYAHYLDPHFYLQWNEWVVAYSQQQQQVEIPTVAVLAALEARLAAVEQRLNTAPVKLAVAVTVALSEDGVTSLLSRLIVQHLRAAVAPVSIGMLIYTLAQAGHDFTPLQVRRRVKWLRKLGYITRVQRGLYRSGHATNEA